MDPLFPKLPKDLSKLSEQEINDLLADCESAAGLIDAEDEEFLAGLSAEEVLAEYKTGAEQILILRSELASREEAAATYAEEKGKIRESLKPVEAVAEVDSDGEAEGDGEGDDEGEGDGESQPEAKAEVEAEPEPEVVDPVAERLAASAEVEPEVEKPRVMRRLPAPAPDRVVVNDEPTKELALVASGFVPSTPPGSRLESKEEVVKAVRSLVSSLGKPAKRPDGQEEKFRVATLDYSENFPEERTLRKGDISGNGEKVAAIGNPFFGEKGRVSLVASGGLCAPLTPIYTQPQLATAAEPVWDSLPTFRAERGGINVPTPTTIADADGSVTVIEEADDALGGTFATKACLAMDCPDYTETAVTIISACREFGNLNAMAWPEKIAHELELTRAFHARTAEGYILDRIVTQSVAVTNGAETLGALIYLVDGIVKARYGIVSRMRMDPETRFRVLLPAILPDLLQLDTIQTQFERFTSEEQLVAYLRGLDIEPTFYLDTPSTGTSQIADTAQTAGALDGLPDTIQWGIFPEGTFLGVDMGELNLGIVRDSTLNSTNDFQYFWETFRNVARIGPAQAAYWVTSDLCASGQFPPAGTARTCD